MANFITNGLRNKGRLYTYLIAGFLKII